MHIHKNGWMDETGRRFQTDKNFNTFYAYS